MPPRHGAVRLGLRREARRSRRQVALLSRRRMGVRPIVRLRLRLRRTRRRSPRVARNRLTTCGPWKGRSATRGARATPSGSNCAGACMAAGEQRRRAAAGEPKEPAADYAVGLSSEGLSTG